MQKKRIYRGGFALPTVLIASVVMLTVLAVAVSSVAAVRTSLKVQYYEQLAKAAGEAGVALAKACLAKNGNVPLWTDAKPLTPATDCAGNVLLSPAIQVLVVAGGGGGGDNHGGGGGGGGVVYQDTLPISPGTYSVTVGAGGAGATSTGAAGGNGGNSTFDSYITALGGGGGGGRIAANSVTQPGNGGNGGGGAGTIDGGTGVPAAGGSGTPGQGNDGGSGSSGSNAGNGGGGGGAGGPGGAASGVALGDGTSGAGGIGLYSDITGQQLYFGGGGSGGRWDAGNVGIAGLTGGGIGGASAGAGAAGQANTGGGGGGGANSSGNGGNGGSGIVIVRYGYDPSSPAITASGGSTYTDAPYRIHRFKTSGTFTVTATGTASCPSDPRCSVTVNGNIRSSFSVGKPTVGADGRAISIPNNGYVQLLRSSTGQVWRTYQQPATQVAAVPDLCSGSASSALGWSNAVVSSNQSSIPNASAARSITLSDDDLNAGRMYFRKDFTVTQSGTYSVAVQTTTAADLAELYIDGSPAATAQGQVANASVSLPVGCHTVTVRLTNRTLLPRHSQFTAAIQQAGSAPIVASDSSWRVSSGSSVHFSSPDFYADPSIWGPVTDMGLASAVSNWTGASGDSFSRFISSSCTSTCPPSSSTYFRDDNDFVVSNNTDVLVSVVCDDDCSLYVDGNLVIASSTWSNINQETLTLTPGSHHIGVRLYNSGSAANPSKFAVSVVDKSTGTVLTRSDDRWYTANNTWISGTNAGNDPMSYEASFRPSPSEIADPTTYDVLVVAGGGGGGGNCATCGGAGGGGAGGVSYAQNVTATLGTQTVVVGPGGNGGAGGGGRTNGTNGGASMFGSIYVPGGGGGGAQLGIAGNSGASGGGGAGGNSPAAGAGGSSIAGFGWDGGGGSSASAFQGGGGGGAGGSGVPGSTTAGGDGGAGFINYLTGSRMIVGGGGGGGTYNAGTVGNGDAGSGGNGSTTTTNGGTGYPGTANTGGGGGGANGSNTGGAGGAGGSGVIVLRFKKNSLSYALGGSGGRTQTEATINGVVYTIITFTSGTSTFQITAINS